MINQISKINPAFTGRFAKSKGIALVAVLAVLTVLAILAASFVTLTSMHSKTSQAGIDAFRAKLLIESGLQHAISLVQHDISKEGLLCDSAETDPLILNPKAGNLWHIVKDGNGNPIGRYKFKVTDESGKLNVNFLPELAQHVVSNSKENKINPRKNPLFTLASPKIIGKILAYQYGPNHLPGLRHVDDNNNNILLENDGIDNNFNGVIDEIGEGIDEPSEFNPLYPKGDDRAIISISEVADFLKPLSPDGKYPGISNLSKIFTTRSNSKDISSIEENKRVNINSATVRHIAQTLRYGRSKKMGAELASFACNIADFKDENHVVSTFAGGYGVEAICFSEIMANDASHMLEPHLINPIPTGKGNNLVLKYTGVIGVTLDPEDKSGNEPVAKYPMKPIVISKVGENVKVKYNGPPIRSSVDPTRDYRALFNALKKRGKTQGDNILYPANFWKNGQVIFRTSGNGAPDEINPDYLPKILRSDARSVTIEGKWGSPGNRTNTYDTLIGLKNNASRNVGFWLNNHWERTWGLFTVHPKCTEWAITEIRPKTYFKVYIGNNGFIGDAFKYNSPLLDCDGNPSSTSWTKENLLKWEYNNGKPIRTDAKGMIDVIFTSSTKCNGKRYTPRINREMDYWNIQDRNKTKSMMTHTMFMRPDIIELVNISDKPISLAGWRVLLNTGSVAIELCRINSAFNYQKGSKGTKVNENPVVPPHGYAYLTSDETIFDIEYGNDSGGWGDSSSESYFCYELPTDTWGTWYKIKGFRPATRNLLQPGFIQKDNNIVLEGANFKEGEMNGEIAEFRTDRKSFKGNNLNGFRRMITGNTKNAVEILYGQHNNSVSGIEKGDYVVILGMPRNGGFLSFTLKNEYNQIASRTIEYGKLNYDEYNVSAERTDPTVMDSWRKTREPSFGGTYTKAKPKIESARKKLIINNRRLNSYKDMLLVSSGKAEVDFSDEEHAKTFLSSYGPLFSMNGKRLDAESAVFIPGPSKKNAWQSTLFTVENSSTNSLSTKNAKWSTDMWKGKTLTFLSGKSRGEQFKIKSNGSSSINIKGYSTQNSIKFTSRNGDKFIVGPPYSTPQFYCQDSGARGIWEWKNTDLNPEISHDLYFSGLNDSINTTEFLEENHNAELTINIWNYKIKDWDKSPKKRYKYNKNDSFYFGKISPENISGNGTVKISIIPHKLVDEIRDEINIKGDISYKLAEKGASGIAWFDYIYFSPTERPGRININTADANILSALPGISHSLARKIENGISPDGNKIRPYKNIFDLLKVKGMTTDILCDIADYLTVRSDTYRVDVLAEIFKTSPKSESISQKNIAACQNFTFVIEREQINNEKWKISTYECININ